MTAPESTELPPPPAGHKHALPWSSGGYGSTDRPDETLIRCACGQWFVSLPCYESHGPVTKWYRVRWWHFRFRGRIRQAEGR